MKQTRCYGAEARTVLDVFYHLSFRPYWYIRVIQKDNGQENGNQYNVLGVLMGIMEKKMETTTV